MLDPMSKTTIKSKITVKKINMLHELKRIARGHKTRSAFGPQGVAGWAVPLVKYALEHLESRKDIDELERMFALEDLR